METYLRWPQWQCPILSLKYGENGHHAPGFSHTLLKCNGALTTCSYLKAERNITQCRRGYSLNVQKCGIKMRYFSENLQKIFLRRIFKTVFKSHSRHHIYLLVSSSLVVNF